MAKKGYRPDEVIAKLGPVQGCVQEGPWVTILDRVPTDIAPSSDAVDGIRDASDQLEKKPLAVVDHARGTDDHLVELRAIFSEGITEGGLDHKSQEVSIGGIQLIPLRLGPTLHLVLMGSPCGCQAPPLILAEGPIRAVARRNRWRRTAGRDEEARS